MKGFWSHLVVGLCLLLMISCKSFLGRSGHDGLSLTDCLADRKNQETLRDQKGSITKVAEQYIILSEDGNSRYLACNLPETYNNEGEKVTFTLVVKEIFPNERLIATPAYLTEIKP